MLKEGKPGDVILYLKKRKGFIKLALMTGSPVVPVFCFNMEGSYGFWFPKGSLAEWVSRQMGCVPLLFWGRWCIPYGIPHPKKIHVVIGQGKQRLCNDILLNSVHDCPSISQNCIFQPLICPNKASMSHRKALINTMAYF